MLQGAPKSSPKTPPQAAAPGPLDALQKGELNCTICPYRGHAPSTLQQHMYRVHPEARPFGCIECKEKFRFATSLAKHYCKKHGNNIDIGFDQNGVLTRRRSGGQVPKVEAKVELQHAKMAEARVELKHVTMDEAKVEKGAGDDALKARTRSDAHLHQTRHNRQVAMIKKRMHLRAARAAASQAKKNAAATPVALRANRLRRVRISNYRLLSRTSPGTAPPAAPEAKPATKRAPEPAPPPRTGRPPKKSKGKGSKCKRSLKMADGDEQAQDKEKDKDKGGGTEENEEEDDDEGEEIVEDDSTRVAQEVPADAQLVYKCDECDARFRHAMQLEMHELEHETGGDAGVGALFECIQCGRAFALEETLRWHIEAEHTVAVKGAPGAPNAPNAPSASEVIDISEDIMVVGECRREEKVVEIVEIPDDDDEVAPKSMAVVNVATGDDGDLGLKVTAVTSAVDPLLDETLEAALLGEDAAEAGDVPATEAPSANVEESELNEAVTNILQMADEEEPDDPPPFLISSVSGASDLVSASSGAAPVFDWD
ncbi:uncharacterized protein LOC127749248 [Frankliniella occidentalis]|uniref:Uncharacterized protein LOC127749248 n=1 Tax=Frankliniella occidentalis TaxID=133901 RepID=A0A9C6U7J1_FRAOC|nr:uncharacterized protein LOC127749248 [Frankliniella occidentalis]XP_052122610.1 uncharacterized protein LOC127749248 [Frankliniella occidentalis]